jgi:hypothetical protein
MRTEVLLTVMVTVIAPDDTTILNLQDLPSKRGAPLAGK